MIVVDTNVLAYMLIDGDKTLRAKRLYEMDGDWITSSLSGYEFCNVLSTYVRHKLLSVSDAKTIYANFETFLQQSAKPICFPEVIELSAKHKISAYDACFLALAIKHDVPLISEDKKLQQSAPNLIFSIDNYLHQHVH